MSLASSPEKDFYQRQVSGAEISSTPPLEEFAAGAKPMFERGMPYGLVSKFLADRKVERLAEIGCGGGESVAWMKRYAQEIIGADIALPPHLKNNRFPGFQWLELNANDRLPFSDASLDVVVTMSVVEHVFDPFHYCAEIHRVLKKEGLVFLFFPLVTGLRNRLRILSGKLPITSTPDWFEKRQWDGGHLHYFSMEMAEKLFAVSGLQPLEYACEGRFYPLKEWFPRLLAGNIAYVCRKASAPPRVHSRS